MAFVTGLFLIDAPASALNNMGQMEGTMTDNAVGVKCIWTREGAYPYVSAQAFRYWLRSTLEKGPWGWRKAPIYREEKIAYTDANPIRWWDDDLFGYMRAPSKRASAAAAREADAVLESFTPVEETVTRVSPFRVSTLVSLAPVRIVNDFGVMARHEGDPVPHEHQFYRATLQSLFSLDLHAAGTFTYRQKTGYLNLDKVRMAEAQEKKLEELPEEKAYRLPVEERLKRISALLEALAQLEGGAKQALHYTDITPDLLIAAVTRGGNNIFGHVIGVDSAQLPVVKIEALRESLTVFNEEILSRVYIGWVKGYRDEERKRFEASLEAEEGLKSWREKIVLGHPREVLKELVGELESNPSLLA
ncbi:type I-B CRISPR-associated protein Cas7/Cst2/DevR [Desulfofundulus thermobenzoicus]|uniref:Type I-B CRISPR-associated protein Cas7/Cst2/DevR n=1 Tax=Desulfofundulus thermobenzoicus TaxID=29376 RepID=A0A6N7IL42_9FIRM|nr:type I-B CRISPR-associated protein Cas7/Cst2/DevR [Desulfofundulus thermobenzoicus]MQL50696.1 type I-B CRISPR-associated protein Cas7/Cst2/DevR [Desulfofundulus thermobenzoicus]HHW43837.1 type I-B CRISPR-associated protein Cas7/Cst2/DevR [Desulfotomaculum sp.]